jgi:hypothetical protein
MNYEAKNAMWQRSRCGFLVAGAATVAGIFGCRWIREPEQNWIYDRAFKFNEAVSHAYCSPARHPPGLARQPIGTLRVNDGEGMSENFNQQTWRRQVVGRANERQFPQYTDNIAYETAMDNSSEMRETGSQHEQVDAKAKPGADEMPPETMDRAAASQMPGLLLTLDDIKNFPRVEMTTELKCIESWNCVVNWVGARFSDSLARFLPNTKNSNPPDISRPQDFLRYVSLVTPDGGYYVGMDMPSILHPQTLLVYECSTTHRSDWSRRPNTASSKSNASGTSDLPANNRRTFGASTATTGIRDIDF